MRAILILFVALAVSGCVTQTAHHGFYHTNLSLDSIKVGAKKEELVAQIGYPSARSLYGDEKWFYIGRTLTRKAFLNPEVSEQFIYAVTFANGAVESIERYDITKGTPGHRFESDFTPTQGDDYGVLQQMIGNIGRFNTPKKTNNR